MELTQITVNAYRMLVAKFSGSSDYHSATMLPIDPTGTPYGPENSLPTSDNRHETHAATQDVYTVTTVATTLAALIGGDVPAWATAARLYVGSTSGIVYSTDGEDPAYEVPDATHGVPLDAYDRSGHLIVGAESVAALRLVAMTADVKVTVELMG